MTRVTDTIPAEAPAGDAQRVFSMAIVISGIRCLIAYILLPFVMPILGLSPAVGPWLGIVIGVVAIAANVFSIRRFARSNHRLRTLVIGINIAVIGLLLVLLAIDIGDAIAIAA
jgi:hypothetical protein